MGLRTAVPACLCAVLAFSAARPAGAETLEAASAAGAAAFSSGLQDAAGLDFSAFKKPSARPPAQSEDAAAQTAARPPLYVVDLPPQLNAMRRSTAAFRVAGSVVHVFGTKSQNKKNWFLGVQEDGQAAQFVNGRQAVHWMWMNGTGHVVIAGKPYDVYIKGQIRHRMESKVVLEPSDHSLPPVLLTVQQITDAVYASGLPLRLGGREYRLLYTQDFVESDGGAFSAYSTDRSLALMFRDDDGSYQGYHWFEREIPEDKVLIATPRASNENDGQKAGELTLGLRLAASRLELYYPVSRPGR